MIDRFLICLAATLHAETSYRQPVGGPYVRLGRNPKRGDPRETGKPDGLAFDDDPDDTGGRTCMGLLQREYDPYRRAQGQPCRDVWQIDDQEIDDLYRAQYWDACQCAKLPAGVDLAVFDSAVNCGVGMGAKFLQRALGVRDDGHIGVGTLAAATDANAGELIAKIIGERESYHRKCKTFWKHGKGWLERDAATIKAAQAMLGDVERAATRTAAIADAEPNYLVAAENSRRATPEDQPPPSMADSKIGNTQGLVGAGSTYVAVGEISTAAQTANAGGKFSFTTFALHLLSSQAFMLAAFTLATAVATWVWRAQHNKERA